MSESLSHWHAVSDWPEAALSLWAAAEFKIVMAADAAAARSAGRGSPPGPGPSPL